jgi:hypothetical protein
MPMPLKELYEVVDHYQLQTVQIDLPLEEMHRAAKEDCLLLLQHLLLHCNEVAENCDNVTGTSGEFVMQCNRVTGFGSKVAEHSSRLTESGSEVVAYGSKLTDGAARSPTWTMGSQVLTVKSCHVICVHQRFTTFVLSDHVRMG